jgi:hypothetical protein
MFGAQQCSAHNNVRRTTMFGAQKARRTKGSAHNAIRGEFFSKGQEATTRRKIGAQHRRPNPANTVVCLYPQEINYPVRSKNCVWET